MLHQESLEILVWGRVPDPLCPYQGREAWKPPPKNVMDAPPLGWLTLKRLTTVSVYEDMGKLETLIHYWWECKMV